MTTPRFRPADDFGTHPAEMLERERSRIRLLIGGGVLELTGGSSLPGALTGGDVDLHLRVGAEEFDRVVEALGNVYDVVHPEIWSTTLATFSVPGDDDVGVAVTPIGSEHDRRFVSAWMRLGSDGTALAAYNALKRAHAHSDEATYRRAKAQFFDEINRDAQDPLP